MVDPKSKLTLYCQQEGLQPPKYHTTGSLNDWTVYILHGTHGHEAGTFKTSSKKEAEMKAAALYLSLLESGSVRVFDNTRRTLEERLNITQKNVNDGEGESVKNYLQEYLAKQGLENPTYISGRDNGGWLVQLQAAGQVWEYRSHQIRRVDAEKEAAKALFPTIKGYVVANGTALKAGRPARELADIIMEYPDLTGYRRFDIATCSILYHPPTKKPDTYIAIKPDLGGLNLVVKGVKYEPFVLDSLLQAVGDFTRYKMTMGENVAENNLATFLTIFRTLCSIVQTDNAALSPNVDIGAIDDRIRIMEQLQKRLMLVIAQHAGGIPVVTGGSSYSLKDL